MQLIEAMEPMPSETVPQGENWVAQVKWDGVRILTYFDGTHVELYNRKRWPRTLHYPELNLIRSYCSADSVILDGEVIALGADGKPDFHQVMKRDGLRRMERVKQVAKSVPIHYMVFDILYLNGEWILHQPFRVRFGPVVRGHHPQRVRPVGFFPRRCGSVVSGREESWNGRHRGETTGVPVLPWREARCMAENQKLPGSRRRCRRFHFERRWRRQRPPVGAL